MQPNLYKVVYYQWLIDVLFWKSGPEVTKFNRSVAVLEVYFGNLQAAKNVV